MVIKDKKRSENHVVELTKKELEIQKEFLDEKIFVVKEIPWSADITNYKPTRVFPPLFN